jgi:hypothetical protein
MLYRAVFEVRTNFKLRRVVAISFAAIFGLTTLLGSWSVAKAQELKWSTSAGGADFEFSYAIAADLRGNSYVTGLFTGPATFGAGEANETVLKEEFGVFVTKYADGVPFLILTQVQDLGFLAQAAPLPFAVLAKREAEPATIRRLLISAALRKRALTQNDVQA